jgi:hypothetical protein
MSPSSCLVSSRQAPLSFGTGRESIGGRTAVSVNAGEVQPWRRRAVSSSGQSRRRVTPSSNPGRQFQDLRPSLADTLSAWKIVNEPLPLSGIEPAVLKRNPKIRFPL